MNNILLSNKRERTKENREIIITLEKIGSNNFKYFNDTLQDRTKIKIPIFDEKEIEQKNIQSYEKIVQIKEKQNSINIKIPVQSLQNNIPISPLVLETKSINSENRLISSLPEEIPLLQKYVEKNIKQPIIIPTCTQWFSFDGINEIETKTLPEFFCGVFPGKTPEVYKEYRNYIINLFRENTNAYLSSSSNSIIDLILNKFLKFMILIYP